ncbi:hypothetical protein SAMN05444169_0841 [Bradyrhizobium erythrophlei]|jgi:hypothetical protein|uniref:Uncharacterized protein n=1 Tax=Bradyrhizobium erythrophlei TaxID=1437360 RepID=A0A1M5HI85_9BRAD|nr:hypothetical protein SAMN05444169_0841 [Bradyrhizobium erythrophlei]
MRAKSRSAFLKLRAYQDAHKNNKRGGIVSTRNNPFPEQQAGFTTGDILWALGIWTVILGLSPVIVFYMLMVA